MEYEMKTNVLIVGSGPSGMTMALALAKFGISSTLIDRRESPATEPRAHALNSRSLEIFSSLGMNLKNFEALATPLRESCHVRWVENLSGGEFGSLPYERMHPDEKLPTPWPLFNISQPDTEKVLNEYVDQEPLVHSCRGWQWKSCDQSPEGVDSVVVDAVGTEHRIFSRFLVGADGAGSPVRESQGISMKGMGIIHDFVMIHFKADLTDIVQDRPAILYWVMDQACPGTFIAFDRRDNWVFMAAYDESDTDLSTFTDEFCRELVLKAIGQADVDVEILSQSFWGLGSQVAESYRSGNVFLVGDSAHRYPPSGGLGLNTGVGDAHNLAWKMAGVLRGWAWPGLLDSYHTEREHVAQINAEFSTENAGKMFSVMLAAGTLMPEGMQSSFEELRSDPVRWAQIQEGIEEQRDHFDGLALHIGQHYGRERAADLRADNFQFSDVGARFPHAWLSVNGGRISSLELLSASRFTLFTRSNMELPAIDTEVPYQLQRESADFVADSEALVTLGMDEATLVIVRPDGHIAERFFIDSVSAQELKDALSRATAKFVALEEVA